MSQSGNSLAVQWLGLCIFTAEHPGSILGRGTKILQVLRCSQGKKKKTESTSLPKPLHDAVTGCPQRQRSCLTAGAPQGSRLAQITSLGFAVPVVTVVFQTF